MATQNTLSPSEIKIKNYKRQIETLRQKLTNPAVSRNPEQSQLIYDEIEEIKHKIEGETRATRKAVPVTNAPIVGQRQAASSKRKRHFTI